MRPTIPNTICTRLLAIACASLAGPAASNGQADAPKPPLQAAPANTQTWQFGPVQLTRRCDPVHPLVSDPLRVHIEATAPAPFDVELGEHGDVPQGVTIERRRGKEPDAGPAGTQRWIEQLTIDVLGPGTYTLPALEVRYRSSPAEQWNVARTEPLEVEFQSMLDADSADAEPRPNPGPIPMPPGPFPWIPVLIGLAAAAAASALLAARLRRNQQRIVPTISAYRKASDALRQLEQAAWLEQGEIDRFYTELSAIVRRYVEDRFRLRAPEQTTEEFLQELSRRPVLTQPQAAALSEFLTQCDLVKFARMRPTLAECHAALRAARSFLDATRDDTVLVEHSEAQ